MNSALSIPVLDAIEGILASCQDFGKPADIIGIESNQIDKEEATRQQLVAIAVLSAHFLKIALESTAHNLPSSSSKKLG